ncbi:MAG: outer membrane beta-barrel family protein [Pedobacter sp.]
MKLRFTLYLLIILSFFFFEKSQAQADKTYGEISGTVLDETGKAFPYASLSLLNARDSTNIKGTLSSDKGTFRFSDLKDGAYLVAYYVVGYKKVVKGPFSISSKKFSYALAKLQMLQDVTLLQGVEIIKQKPLIERQVDKTVINVENSVLATGNTALEILEKAPGVTVDKDGNISLKGKQGVMIMLDGKPTYLSSEQVANMLRSTEGNAIQAIELITNPSSKYDASGNSGIINIRLKKNRNYGTNGALTGGAGYGRYYKANSGLSLNHREQNFNVFGNFDYGRNKRFGGTDIVRLNNTAQNATYFDQTNSSIRYRNNSNYKAGVDYFISDKNTVGFAMNGYRSNGHNTADVLTLIGSAPQRTDSSVVAQSPSDYNYHGMSYNLNFKSTIDSLGQELSIDADHSRYIGDENDLFDNRYFNAAGQVSKPTYVFRNATPTSTVIWAGKADYSYPFSKEMKLEVGVKSSIVKTDNNFRSERQVGSDWQNDLGRSNQFLYDENINAAYGNFKTKYKHISLQLGLRLEQTNSKGNSITQDKVVNRHYLNLFPSVFVNQELSTNHEIGVSYSRRIDRPDYGSLNPFISFLDLYTYRFGNPFLKPQYTNAFEFSYSHKKTLNVTLGYSHTSDVISDVLLLDTAKKTISISKENLSTQDSYNLNVNYPLQFFKWWSSSNNGTTYYNEFKTADIGGSPYQSGRVSFNLNTTQNFTISPTTTIEASGYYQSKQIYGTIVIDPQYGIDLGVKQSFFKKKLDIKLSGNDIFKMQKSRITSALASQNYVVKERWESQVFRLTGVYRFGSSQIKGARERSGSSAAEEKRVKSGG